MMTHPLKVFQTIDATREPWLNKIYVPLPDSQLVLEPISTVIFARTGQGRSALAWVGLRQSSEERTLIPWNLHQASSLREHPLDLFQHLEVTLFRYILRLLHQTTSWDQLASWHRGYLAWMAQGLEPPPPWEPEAPLWQQLQNEEVPQTWVHTFEQQPWEQRVRPLVHILHHLGIHQIWIVVDIPGEKEDDAKTRALLQTLFQVLAFFDMPLVFKFFLPRSWKNLVYHSPAWQRHRVQAWEINWTHEALRDLVEKRLSWVRGHPTTFEAICQGKWLWKYLLRACGDVPREWIIQLRPIVQQWYQNRFEPLPEETCRQLLYRHPPTLVLDDQQRVVRVGGREIPYGHLPERGLTLLQLLLQRYPGVVSTEEAYRHAYNVTQIDTLSLRSMQRALDTLVHRLRRVLEPDPHYPVLLVRERRQGLQLRQMSE